MPFRLDLPCFCTHFYHDRHGIRDQVCCFACASGPYEVHKGCACCGCQSGAGGGTSTNICGCFKCSAGKRGRVYDQGEVITKTHTTTTTGAPVDAAGVKKHHHGLGMGHHTTAAAPGVGGVPQAHYQPGVAAGVPTTGYPAQTAGAAYPPKAI